MPLILFTPNTGHSTVRCKSLIEIHHAVHLDEIENRTLIS
jgi:hypothetical protein